MLEQHKDQLSYFITNQDLDQFVRGASEHVERYGELDDKYKSIYELLPTNNSYQFILTESEPNLGHWCIIMRYGNTVEWFDPYGGSPTSSLKFIPKIMNRVLDNTPSDIKDLVKTIEKGDKFVWNKTKFQYDHPLVNTCGRHCLSRLQCMLLGMDLKQYQSFMRKQSKALGLPFDVVSCLFIRI